MINTYDIWLNAPHWANFLTFEPGEQVNGEYHEEHPSNNRGTWMSDRRKQKTSSLHDISDYLLQERPKHLPKPPHQINYSREFLNLPNFHSHANIITRVQVDENENMLARIDITDCKNTCHFMFNDRGDEFQNNVHKISTMINVLQKFKSDLIKVQNNRINGEKNW